jgi:hypothetical protein
MRQKSNQIRLSLILAICLCTQPVGRAETVGTADGTRFDVSARPTAVDVPGSVATGGHMLAPAALPTSYPDTEGFARRAQFIFEHVANNDLGQWRRGYFSGGDPGKYLPGAAMGKLALNPDDAESRQYLNDDRSYREHYHFAAIQWPRLLGLFRDALTDDTVNKLRAEARKYGAYLNPGGTENHKTMWLTTANLLPHQLDTGISNKSKDESIATAKAQLTRYVKGLFAVGMGEWDSSTYLMFDINGFLNLYDFSPDPEVRLIARAALDWYVTTYALKHRAGVFTAPNQRGYAKAPYDSIADQTGFLWFSDRSSLDSPPRFLYALHAATSSYRPNVVLYNLATQTDLPLIPFEQLNTKPNYWYGQNITPEINNYAERVYVAEHYTMGMLLNGFGGQITRFQIVTDDGHVLTAGHPRRSDHTTKKLDEFGYEDGLGRYEQSTAVESTAIIVNDLPADEPIRYSFVTLPDGATTTTIDQGILISLGKTSVFVQPIDSTLEVGTTDLTPKQISENTRELDRGRPAKHQTRPIIRVTAADGSNRPAVILEVADDRPEDFLRRIRSTEIESRLGEDGSLRYRAATGRVIDFKLGPGNKPTLRVDEGVVDPYRWDWVYSGPYVNQRDGILNVTDGRQGFSIDFTGELPVYGPPRIGLLPEPNTPQ